MAAADWIVIALFVLLMAGIGLWSYRQVDDADDFFAAGGKLPWWLGGISHHMSGYSGAVFVGHAGVAYTYGFTLYVWWALPISLGIFIGAFLIAPRWPRLRVRLGMVSPMEYLATRYNVPAQQLMACSGVLLKLFDVGAKWASIALILNVFAGVPVIYGILISGSISLFYITLGGLWADALTDLAQFVVQLVAGICLFVVVLNRLDGFATISTLWQRLPPDHSNWFNGPYTPLFVGIYSTLAFLSYNGGTWNLAQRYIASPTGGDARKAALLSAALYLFWPLILFFPMWAAPLFLPGLRDPSQAYSLMAVQLLPPGLVGLVLASMFAHTMAMTTSDANTIAAVITRDILPVIAPSTRNFTERQSLLAARVATVVFTALTLAVGANADRYGGVLQLVVVWFAGLVGPTALPMILGLLPAFSRSGANTAIASILAGMAAFAAAQLGYLGAGTYTAVLLPVAVSATVYIAGGMLFPQQPGNRQAFFKALEP